MRQPRAPGSNADRAPTRLGGGPFGAVAPVMAAAAFIVAAAFAAAFTGALPGGRWAVVHLVTLGVASPLILAFSHQFAGSVTQRPADRSAMPLVAALYAGALMVIVGLPSGQRWVTAVGGTAASAAVLASYVRLRRMRRGGGRFAWLLRGYERAHGAFLHGALLGLLTGVGVFRGGWYGAARLAHLHAMVAGWVGVTILATVVFFAPAMLRTRIRSGTEDTAARALRYGVTGLSIAVIALLGSALPASAGAASRVVAGVGLGVYAGAVIVIARITLGVARAARPSPARPLAVAALAWFSCVAIADVVAVSLGAWRWLDAIGLAFAVGVAGQLILAVVLYLLPSLRGRSFAARDRLTARVGWAAGLRAAALNVAAAAIVSGAALDGSFATVLWRAGWALFAALIAWTIILAALPLPADDAEQIAPRAGRPALPVVSAEADSARATEDR